MYFQYFFRSGLFSEIPALAQGSAKKLMNKLCVAVIFKDVFIKKMVTTIIVATAALGAVLSGTTYYLEQRNVQEVILIPNPTRGAETSTAGTEKETVSVLSLDPVINILLIGSDISSERKNKGQYSFNTDATILLTVNTIDKKVLLTSVPRDFWINGNKINALYTIYGWDSLKRAYEDVTGLKISGYVLTDFDGFKWFVDQYNGLKVDIANSFTDPSFPNNEDTGVLTATFNQGTEYMDGERALIYARSRKGNNGEGSDLMRAKRQHVLLQSFAESFSAETNVLKNLDIQGLFNTITQHMETNLALEDALYLWDLFVYRKDYAVESLVLDDTYIYHPGVYPESEYTAWVFLPRDEDFSDIHDTVYNKIHNLKSEDAEDLLIENGYTETNLQTNTY